MEIIETTYLDDLRTRSVHKRSGAEIITDAPKDNRGKGRAFSPTDLFCTSLSTCILTIMEMRAMDSKFSIKGARAVAKKFMASHPRRVKRIEIQIFLPDEPYIQEQLEVLEKAARTCPVGQSIHPEIEEDIKITVAR